MPGKRYALFDKADFLESKIYPRKEVGIIYLTANRKGGIIVNSDREYCYLYDMNSNGFVIPGSYLQCPGKWSRHLNRRERFKFALLMEKLDFKTWKGIK